MKVYQMNIHSLRSYISRTSETPEEALQRYVEAIEGTRFRRTDLHVYGFRDAEIEDMLRRGFLREVDVSREEALSIAGYHKFRTDNEYKDMVLDNFRKAQEKVTLEMRRENVKKAQELKRRKANRRRELLLTQVIAPEFGAPDDKVSYFPPERISIMDVVESLQKYPRIRSLYPGDVYMSVMYDIRALGIKTTEKGERIKKTWRRKLSQNPELVVELRKRAENATESRLRLYEEHPEKALENYRKSAESRRERMRSDPAFRSAVLKRLAKGADGLWKKYRTDKDFREKVRKKQLIGLRKGNKTMQRRAERRRNALRRLIKEKFGSLDNVAGPMLTQYLEESRPAFVRDYYSERSLYPVIKKDLSRLREEEKVIF